jgi:hypothetical protein
MLNFGCCVTPKKCQKFSSRLRYYDNINIGSQYILVLRSSGESMLCSFQNMNSGAIFGGSCDCGPTHKTHIRNRAVLFLQNLTMLLNGFTLPTHNAKH